MNLSLSNQWLQNTLKVVLFLTLVCIIAHLYPHHTRTFKYAYEEGRVWSYETLEAEFSFPIYKTQAERAEEKEAVLSRFAPYYNQQDEAPACQRILESATEVRLPESDRRQLQQQLATIYLKGIIAPSELQQLNKAGYSRITIVNSQHIARQQAISELYTPRTAYDLLLSSASDNARHLLQKMDLNNHLTHSLLPDTATTRAMRQQALDALLPTRGMVQAGEVIIKKGEVVTPRTAQIIRSMQITLEEEGVDRQTEYLSILGNIILIVSAILLLGLYLMVFRPRLFHDLNTLLFFSVLMTLIILMACLITTYTPLSIYLVPFAWVPVITRVFYDSRTALYLHLITVLICAMMAPIPFEFMLIQIGIGMVAVSSLRDMAQRSQLVQTAGWIFLAYCVGYSGFILATTGDWHLLRWQMYAIFALNALLIIFAYGLIYIFEKVFHLLSSITLVELTNINSALMLEFAEKAPGTFQHSLQVSNLAMEAAQEVGANALLVRTGGLYHDIGKMARPEIYIENQENGVNPLDTMDYVEASKAVIAHVTEGVRIARKRHLPAVIEQFILGHHGTSKTRYFYTMYRNAHPNEKVDETLFQYPGPKPHTKETAILMMADAVEARSRSLQVYTEESLSEMVSQMIRAQIDDGQLEDTPLTFRDIERIQEVFTRKLISINHHRIAYPELKK